VCVCGGEREIEKEIESKRERMCVYVRVFLLRVFAVCVFLLSVFAVCLFLFGWRRDE